MLRQIELKQKGFLIKYKFKVEPGPLPFTNDEVDVVFSKDAIIHIPDKETMALDAFLLKPGGQFAASDWLISR